MRIILEGDNLEILPSLGCNFARLIYIDPPFNTGKIQNRPRMKTYADDQGTRLGFAGKKYTTEATFVSQYKDTFDDYIQWLMLRIEAALPCLTADGSLFVHLDWREIHYVKVALDCLLGRSSFKNEIIWAYDYGGRSKSKWSAKHNSILWYAINPKKYIFNFHVMDRIPYMAPGLVTKEKAARGKTPTDVWWHTIVPTNGKERTGYPTQKPLGILERIVKVHSEPNDIVLDFFAGSGTTGEAAAKHSRGYVLIDENPEAVEIMQKRLRKYSRNMDFALKE